MVAIPRVIPYTVDVHTRYTAFGSNMENVWQYAYPEGATPTESQLQLLAGLVRDGTVAAIRAALPTTAQFREVYVRDIHAASGRAQATLNITGLNGTRGGNATAGNLAASITSRTGLTGRRNHGAKRISPFVETDTDGNDIGTTLMNFLLAIAVQWMLNRVAGGMTFVPAVASLTYAGRHAMNSASVLNNFVDSQKTRLTNHGE